MEFKNLYHLLTCPICLVQYNQSNHAPLIMPCSNGHTICRQCAQKLMGSSRKDKCLCPLDKESFDNYHDVSSFRRSLDLTAFITHFNRFQFCQDHPHSLLEIFCVTCRTSICYKCEKKSHQDHITDEIEGVKERADQSRSRLEKCLGDFDKNVSERRKFIEKKESEVIKAFEKRLNIFIEDILKKGKALIDEVKAHFFELKNEKMFDESPELQNIMKWKEKTQEELELLEPELWKQGDCSQIPYVVFDQEEIMKKLNIEAWLETEKKNLASLKTRVNNVFIESNEEFFQALASMSLGKISLSGSLENNEGPSGRETKEGMGTCKFLSTFEEQEESDESNEEDLEDLENLTDQEILEFYANQRYRKSKNQQRRKKAKQLRIKMKM